MNWIKKLFSKKEPKKYAISTLSRAYEFYLYEGNNVMANKNVAYMQKNGWELAGEVSTKYGNNGGQPRMIVPLKRKI
jgi:hypothetical protein